MLLSEICAVENIVVGSVRSCSAICFCRLCDWGHDSEYTDAEEGADVRRLMASLARHLAFALRA